MQLDWQDYARAEQLIAANAAKLVFSVSVKPEWFEKDSGSDRFWYRNLTRAGKAFVLVDPAHKSRELAFDHVRLAAALSQASGKACTHDALPFDTFEFVEKGSAIRFETADARWTCDLSSYTLTRDEKPPKREGELLSPDGKWAAFTKGYNLYVRNTKTNEEIALTSDGKRYYDYATPPESRTTAVTDRLAGKPLPPVACWSPDCRKLVTHRLDQRRVKDLYLIQHSPPNGATRPVLHTYRYPMVGDKDLPLAEYVVLDVESRPSVKVKSAPSLVFYVAPITANSVWWSDDSRHIYIIDEERGHKVLRLLEVDAQTGETRTLIEERGETHLETNLFKYDNKPNVRTLRHGAEFIWFSQRDGWAHLYLYDSKTGALKNQITSGAFAVRDILHVDEKKRWVYFTAGGREPERDPYLRHLYRAKLDGSNLELLTPEDADHTIVFSPSGDYFVDTYSRIDAAPVTVLRAADGAQVVKLEEADIELLLGTGWRWPEPFKVKARDGLTDIYGAIYRPSNFDPDKRYPVIDAIYPGPQIIRTPKSFPDNTNPLNASWYWEQCALAELGFIVVTIDGLGTPFRSKAFHDAAYLNMKDGGGLEDHIAGLKQLAVRYPYMDLNRVGIFGHSGGGFASTKAIFTHPDFYKVAVSSAGNHDNAGYLAGWGERYQGLLDGDNYAAQANAALAHRLQGKLLLVYGDMDDNVHPHLTVQVVDALIKANKDFDLLVMPNRNHSYTQDPYFMRRMWDYFVRHLLGAEPPAGYVIAGQSLTVAG